MKERIPIVLNDKIGGIIVYAENKICYEVNWISLIKGVERQGWATPMIERHISYNISSKEFFVDDKEFRTGILGAVTDYNFYIATDEEKQIIKDELKKRHVKFVKPLNKLVPR